MLLPRLQPHLRAATSSIGGIGTASYPQAGLYEAFAQLSICRVGSRLGKVRYASHNAQGSVNKAKDGPGKRLGAKKSGEQYVIPGNIIFRQRGTHWFAGENCAMGRDHTIYATESGFVKYYKDPEKHPKRQYIGVVFKRDQVLPLPRNSMRRRRLGLVATKMDLHTAASLVDDMDGHTGDLSDGGQVKIEKTSPARKERSGEENRNLQLRPGYMYREGNWEIGRAAERANVTVREFKPRDRWAAWRKTVIKKSRKAEKRGLNRRVKKK